MSRVSRARVRGTHNYPAPLVVCRQVWALFAAFRFKWPPEIRSMFEVATVFSFNLQQTAPECTLPLSFFKKWLLVQVTPLFLVAGIVVIYAAVFVKWWVRVGRLHPRDVRGHAKRYLDLIAGGVLTVFYYFYFGARRTRVGLRGRRQCALCCGLVLSRSSGPDFALTCYGVCVCVCVCVRACFVQCSCAAE